MQDVAVIKRFTVFKFEVSYHFTCSEKMAHRFMPDYFTVFKGITMVKMLCDWQGRAHG